MILDNNQIAGLIDDYERDSKALKEEALKLCWYMRGGLSYVDAMQLSFSERTIINDIVNANLETTKKSGLPFF